MSQARIATWIVGATLLVTSGVALAETAPEDPALEPTTVVAEEAPAVAESVETEPVVEASEEPAVEEADEESGEHPDNHGAVVSEAAHNHDFDEACGNHGAYVKSVAQGGDPAAPECAEAPADEAATDESVEDDAAKGKGAGKGKSGK